jgi:tetratricopeptide (TPR) repeat protein
MDYAGKKEKFTYLLQLTRLRYEYLAEEENKERMRVQNEILNNDVGRIRKIIDNLYQFFPLRIELNILRSEIGYARNHEQVLKYRTLLDHQALADECALLSNSARYHFHTIRAIIFEYTHQYEKAYESCQKILQLFTDFPVLFEEGVSAKIQTLQRKCTIASTLWKFHDAEEDIARLRELKTTQEKYLAQIFQYSFHQEFQINLWTGRFSELLERVPDFEKEYKRYKNKISKTFEIRMLRQISEAFFIEGKFEDALEWLNRAIMTTPGTFSR